MQSIRAGAIYFAIVFAIGFMFGTVRQLLLIPFLGELGGVVIEAPFMAAASYFVAKGVIARFKIANEPGHRLKMGITALALLLANEAFLSRLLRGWTFDQWLGHFKTAQGLLSLGVFLVFAAMPLILLRKPL